MKNLNFLFIVFFVSIANISAQESIKNTFQDKRIPKYELFYNIGWVSIGSGEFSTASKGFASETKTSSGLMLDYLTEINIGLKYYVNKDFAVGLGIGRHTFYERFGGNHIGQSILGSNSSDYGLYISGLKFTPCASYGNIEGGFDIMFPSLGTTMFTEKPLPLGNDEAYNLDSRLKILDEYLQTYLSFYVKIDLVKNTEETVFGAYIKASYDLQTPLGNTTTYDVSQSRYSGILGMTYKLKFY